MNKVFCLSVVFFCFTVHTVSAQETEKEQPLPSRLLSAQSKLVFDVNETDELVFLKQKVETYRRLFNFIDEAYRASTSGGRNRAEVKAELSAAEAEMFRYEGNHTKWLEALKTQEEARAEQLRNAVVAASLSTISFEALCQAELKLLNAQLELKRAMNISKRPLGTGTGY
ncbi:hypothetical protein FACS189419_09910 [Planctomycetales bacterium]|nr:hypothetical protein FACS189419_09910 [Planctomycetales bacterium]